MENQVKPKKGRYIAMIIVPIILAPLYLYLCYALSRSNSAWDTYALIEVGFFDVIGAFVIVMTSIFVIAGIVGLFIENYRYKKQPEYDANQGFHYPH